MTTPINLTKLRHDIRLSKDAGYPIDITAKQALALIDTAEAAIEKERLLNEYPLNDAAFVNADDRLRETLNHYTTTP
jgi:hypothetical protein